MEITDFLLARIKERQRGAETDLRNAMGPDSTTARNARWDLADCEAKRRIIELHESWPVLTQSQPEFEVVGKDVHDLTMRVTQQINWLTTKTYRDQFGSEPPTTPILRALALPDADHPDFQEEWRL